MFWKIIAIIALVVLFLVGCAIDGVAESINKLNETIKNQSQDQSNNN